MNSLWKSRLCTNAGVVLISKATAWKFVGFLLSGSVHLRTAFDFTKGKPYFITLPLLPPALTRENNKSTSGVTRWRSTAKDHTMPVPKVVIAGTNLWLKTRMKSQNGYVKMDYYGIIFRNWIDNGTSINYRNIE